MIDKECAALKKERNVLRTHLTEMARWAADENNVLIGVFRGHHDIFCVCCQEYGYFDGDMQAEIDHRPDCLHMWSRTWLKEQKAT